jgi:hypothetical protein
MNTSSKPHERSPAFRPSQPSETITDTIDSVKNTVGEGYPAPATAPGAGSARRGSGESGAAGRYRSERADPREQYSADRAL